MTHRLNWAFRELMWMFTSVLGTLGLDFIFSPKILYLNVTQDKSG